MSGSGGEPTDLEGSGGDGLPLTGLCDESKCSFGGSCIELSNGMTYCSCSMNCSATRKPVCGSDLIVYGSECIMREASCEQQGAINVVSFASCEGRLKRLFIQVFCSYPDFFFHQAPVEARICLMQGLGHCIWNPYISSGRFTIGLPSSGGVWFFKWIDILSKSIWQSHTLGATFWFDLPQKMYKFDVEVFQWADPLGMNTHSRRKLFSESSSDNTGELPNCNAPNFPHDLRS